jgi:hypothetical protein
MTNVLALVAQSLLKGALAHPTDELRSDVKLKRTTLFLEARRIRRSG